MLVTIGGVKYGKERSKELYTLLGEEKLQRWENVHQPMLTARSLAGVVSLKSGLIVAGGQTHDGRSCTDIEVYNINASQWFKVNQSLCLPIASYNVSLITSQGSIHIIGGQYDQTSRLNKTYSSPIEKLLGDAEECIIGVDSNKKNKNCWTVRHDTPTYQPVTAMLLNNILAIGGWKNSDSIIFKNNVHMFCTQRKTWVYISDLPKGLPLPCSTSASLSPTEILVIGEHSVARTAVYKGSLKVQPCAGEK